MLFFEYSTFGVVINWSGRVRSTDRTWTRDISGLATGSHSAAS